MMSGSPQIVHLGLGHFHRAHQAHYVQKAGEGWSIIGVATRSRDVVDALNAQGCVYTLVEQGKDTQFHRIEVIRQALYAPDDDAAVLDALSSPDTHIITLTITEKGYGADSPVIDLLARGLAARMSPVTVISCDNLNQNGDVLARCVEKTGHEIIAPVCYPNSMVDRITPATTSVLRAMVEGSEGWADRVPVATEPYSEWIIEDNFAAQRPPLDRAGVQFVDSVEPFELRKLRMLNGAHSYLAYAGTVSGYDYVHQAIADPILRAGARGIMREAAQTLPDGLEPDAYADALVARFENPGLRHSLRQIAMDGTEKLPVRLIATLNDLPLAPHCARAVLAWIAFARSEHLAGRLLQDPRAAQITKACEARDQERALAQLLGVDLHNLLAQAHVIE